MKRTLRPKLVLLYGGTIGLVLILFRLATAYGETHLKAPPNIGGQYLSTQAPPGCPNSTRLLLTVLQSGVYLNGFLSLTPANKSSLPTTTTASSLSEVRPSLAGRWTNQQIYLTGMTTAWATCQLDGQTAALPSIGMSAVPITLQGAIAASPDHILTGQLTLTGQSEAWQFTAQRQTSSKPSPTARDH
jgi:hypothetical protein